MKDAHYDLLCEAADDVSRETFERLTIFERRFLEWNRRISLISNSDVDSLWPRHIVDSAQLPQLVPDARRWLDFGSGGGFPGAIVAIMLSGVEGAHVNLVESNRKKAAFLSRIVAETEAPASIHAVRIEDLRGKFSGTETVTARAVADLRKLLNLSRPWLEAGARGLFQKGRDYRREIEDCRDGFTFDLIEHVSRSDPDGIVLEISNLGISDGRQVKAVG